ncbi:hypothetical protein H4S14_002060 [Agrobacterium vitis]|nr:hypothetical protein [Agrobacterium vitis]MBE1438313.1 hypothetical protein [Agrobacterium vitis]
MGGVITCDKGNTPLHIASISHDNHQFWNNSVNILFFANFIF